MRDFFLSHVNHVLWSREKRDYLVSLKISLSVLKLYNGIFVESFNEKSFTSWNFSYSCRYVFYAMKVTFFYQHQSLNGISKFLKNKHFFLSFKRNVSLKSVLFSLKFSRIFFLLCSEFFLQQFSHFLFFLTYGKYLSIFMASDKNGG